MPELIWWDNGLARRGTTEDVRGVPNHSGRTSTVAPPLITGGDPAGLLASFQRRLLDSTKRVDYLAAFVLAIWPAVLAYFIGDGAHRTITLELESGDYEFLGYWSRLNWISSFLLARTKTLKRRRQHFKTCQNCRSSSSRDSA